MSTLRTKSRKTEAQRYDWKLTVPGRREILWNSGFPARAYATLVFIGNDLVVLLLTYGVVSLLFKHRSLEEYKMFFVTFHPCILLSVVGFMVYGLYPGFCLAPAEELRRYTQVVLLVNAIWLGVKLGFIHGSLQHAVVLITCAFISIPLLTGCRVAMRALVSRFSWWGIPVVVFGAGREGQVVINRLLRCRWIGYKPEVVLDRDPRPSGSYQGIPILSDLSLGDKLAKEYGYSTALIAMANGKHAERNDFLTRYTKSFPTFILLTNHSKYLRLYTSIRDFEGSLGLSTTKRLLVPYNIVIDRIIDLFIVIIGGLIFLPLFLILMVLIRLDSPGPIFYCHRRLGKDGTEFRLWKFRTMAVDADRRLSSWLAHNPVVRSEWKANHKIKNDPRVTRIGRFLRKTSLDEMPQLWNVLKGEMSVIGPRPIIQSEVANYGSKWSTVSSVLPGMTGLWQVSGRSDTGFHERVELDNYYIQNWSIWLDLYIIFKTAWIVLMGKGAY